MSFSAEKVLNSQYGGRAITVISGTKAANGDNELVAAPGANRHIVLVRVSLQNESSSATTMKLTDGAGGAALERFLGQSQGSDRTVVYPSDARVRLSANTALVLNLSGANSCGYVIDYYLE